jgi:tRNA nucleotidyltransferase (CCA-adding enzyme)
MSGVSDHELVSIPAPEGALQRLWELEAIRALGERLGSSFTPAVLLVGGAVRDLLLGRSVVDLDLLVDGPIEPVIARLGAAQRSHTRFCTATLLLAGKRCDLARARRERYPHPGALPRVEPGELGEDLARRDFTVNAIAIVLTGPRRGALLALGGALEDLEARRLAVIHPASFLDDPTRLMRLARYAARLRFEIAAETLSHAADAIRGRALETVSGARLGNELLLSAREPDPVSAFAALRELGIDRAIDPQFGLTDDAWAWRALEVLPADGRPERVLLALALRRLRSDSARSLLQRLAIAARDSSVILQAAAGAAPLAGRLERVRGASELAEVATGQAPETVALAGALGPAAQATRWLDDLRHRRLEIDGSDLLAAGLEEGPAVGRGLAAARVAALDGHAVSREAQLRVALEAAGIPPARG